MLLTLCVTEITSWGVLYYAFTVMSGDISADKGWSAPAVTGAFSAGLVTRQLWASSSGAGWTARGRGGS